METELSLLARAYEYFSALLPYWWALAAGGIFALEPMTESLLRQSHKEWLDLHWPKEARHRHFRWASTIAILIAGFFAFDDLNTRTRHVMTADQATITSLRDERDAARKQAVAVSPAGQQQTISKLETELNATKGALAAMQSLYSARHLSKDQEKTIRQVAKSPETEPYSFAVFQPPDCRDCNEYSTEFIEPLSTPAGGWHLRMFTTMHGGINPRFRGVALLVKDAKNPPPAAIALANALTAAKVQFTGGQADGSLVVMDGEVGILIGPKEGQ
jgi:hypothetical protein